MAERTAVAPPLSIRRSDSGGRTSAPSSGLASAPPATFFVAAPPPHQPFHVCGSKSWLILSALFSVTRAEARRPRSSKRARMLSMQVMKTESAETPAMRNMMMIW